jgi:hypothetical protein
MHIKFVFLKKKTIFVENINQKEAMGRQTSYTLQKTNSPTIFEFISEGPKGSIRKRVEFERTSRADTFNLAFGDVNSQTGDFDDTVVTDNFDTEKVLATVAETVRIFLNKKRMLTFM